MASLAPLPSRALRVLLVALALGACAPQPPAPVSEAAVAPSPKPTGAIDVTWAVADDLPVRGRTVAAVVTVTATQAVEDAVVTFAFGDGVRVVGPQRRPIGALAAGESRRVPVSLDRGADGPAEVRATVRATTADGTPAGRADVLYVLSGPTTFAARGSFVVARQDSLRHVFETGRLTRDAYDEARRQLGAGTATVTVTSGATKSAARTLLVTGTIRYQDSNGAFHPARDVTVEVWDEDLDPDDLLQTTTTDDAGLFATVVPEDVLDSPDLYLRVRTVGTGFYVVTPTHQGDPSEAYFVSTIGSVVNNAAADTDIDVDIANTTAAGNAFSIHDALVESTRYVTAISGALATLSVEFAGPYPTSYYSAGSGLFVLLLDRYDWDVVHHEHGHYVADQINIENNPGGNHGLGENLGERVGKDEGVRLAWGEAWPTYFAISLQRERNSAALGIPNVGDLQYQDTEDAIITYHIETQAGGASMGEDNELAVQRALWDLYDGTDDERDEVSLGDVAVWNTLAGAGPVHVSQAWAAFINGLTDEQKSTYGAIFADHNIAPDPTAPADGFVIPLSGPVAPPTFTWDANGAGPSNQLDKFTVAFYSEDWATLIYETPELNTPQYAPTRQDLALNVFRTTNRVRWVVKGRNASAPATGIYWSPSRLVVSSGVDVAFVIDDTGSMGEEISGVRQGLLNHLSSYPDDGSTTFQLITFKDGVNVGVPTSDLSAIQGAVGSLVASGGGDCPEGSVEAILAAEQQIKDGGRLFLATDADPHPGTDTPGAINTLRARGVRVDVMLSGTCTGEGRLADGGNGPRGDGRAAGPEAPAKPASARLAYRADARTMTAVADTLVLGDDDFAEVVLPFAFPFGGHTHLRAFVGSNGAVTFAQGSTDYVASGAALASGLPRIAVFWRDLNPGGGGRIFVQEVGGDAVITYRDVAPYSGSGTVTATLTLHADGTFEIVYGEVSIASGVVGVSVGSQPSAPPATDLSAATPPIDADPAGVVFEAFTSGTDLGGLTLAFDDVETEAPVPPPVYNAIEAFSLLAFQTGGVFAYVPEINTSDPLAGEQFQNTVFNLVQGGVNQSLVLVQPARVPQGARVTVEVTGSGTTFLPGVTQLAVSGGGVAVVDVTVLSPVRLAATLDVAAGADLSFRDLTATTAQGGGDVDTATGTGALVVTTAPSTPTVLSVTPSVGAAGTTATVTVRAIGTTFGPTSELQMSDGITVSSVEVTSATELRAVVEIAPTARVGRRTVQVVTDAEVAGAASPGLFFVAADAPAAASIASSTPAGAPRGSEVTIAVTGLNTSFANGTSVLSLSGTGITTVSTTVASPTQLSAVVQIAADAPLGARDVRVTTGSEVVALLDAFVVSDLVLVVPALTSPSDGATGLTAVPTLAWSGVTLATRYEVQVDTDDGFPAPVVAETVTETSLTPAGLTSNTTYHWRIRALGDGEARSEWSVPWSFALGAVVAAEDGVPTEFAFHPGAPNPFSGETRLRFDLPRAAHVTLTVFDVRGARMAVVAEGDWPAGRHAVDWRAEGLPAGLYLCRLQTEDATVVQRVVLIR